MDRWKDKVRDTERGLDLLGLPRFVPPHPFVASDLVGHAPNQACLRRPGREKTLITTQTPGRVAGLDLPQDEPTPAETPPSTPGSIQW